LSLFGLGESQGGFSHTDFISSRDILKSLSSFGFIFSTVLVIDLGCLVVSNLVCLVSVVILVNHRFQKKYCSRRMRKEKIDRWHDC
jgi:hypothetical protein